MKKPLVEQLKETIQFLITKIAENEKKINHLTLQVKTLEAEK